MHNTQKSQTQEVYQEDGERKQKGRFECSYCQRQFSRPSHLDRHRLTHLPPERRLTIPCTKCGKVFGRNDVLLRHLRAAHQIDLGPRQTAQRSCDRCVQKRRRCDRGRPCHLCAAAGERCHYPPGVVAVHKREATSGDESSSSQVTTGEIIPPPYVLVEEGAQVPGQGTTPTGSSLAFTSPQSLPETTSSTDPPESFYGQGYHHHHNRQQQQQQHYPPQHQTQTPTDHSAVPFLGGPLNNDPATSVTFLPHGSGAYSPPFSEGDYYLAAEMPFVASLTAAGQTSFRTSGLDWLDFDINDVCHPSSVLEAQPLIEPSLLNQQVQSSQMQQQSQQQHQQQQHILQTQHLPQPQQPLLGLSLPSQHPNTLPWPFEQNQDFIPYRCSLPPLRQVLQSTVCAAGRTGSSHGSSTGTGRAASNSTVAGVIALMSEARIPPPDEVTEPHVAQAVALLTKLVDVYIARFHSILPLLHLPTWGMTTGPTVLVAAMACIGGLLLSEDESLLESGGGQQQQAAAAAELAGMMSEICMPMITWLGSSDSTNYRDISYLGALCLHQIYSLGSGNRQLYQNADRSRGTLVGSLRGIGCLTTRLEGGLEEAAPPTPSSGGPPTVFSAGPAGPDEAWAAWIAREREKRTAWSSFEYDCSLCTLTARRAAVDLSELPSRLPCSETLWEAPSAEAWAALRARIRKNSGITTQTNGNTTSNNSENAFGAPVSAVLQALLRRQPVPRNISYWGKRLCAQVIGRLLWDLKQLEIISTSEYFGMPALATAEKENKAHLLYALDSLLASMDQPVSTADLIHYNLICHYSHLYTAQDLLDIVLYIVRNTVSQGAKLDRGIQIATCRLQSTLARDPRTARLLVWHAAQIVAVANDYLVSAPCEIMRLFMGYVFLLAYARYCPQSEVQQQQQQQQMAGPDGLSIRLDLPAHCAESAGALSRWIDYGGPAALGSVDNIYGENAALAICRDAQKMLRRLRCWGLAEKFAKILESFEGQL